LNIVFIELTQLFPVATVFFVNIRFFFLPGGPKPAVRVFEEVLKAERDPETAILQVPG
jgi:hypothetical protein